MKIEDINKKIENCEWDIEYHTNKIKDIQFELEVLNKMKSELTKED